MAWRAASGVSKFFEAPLGPVQGGTLGLVVEAEVPRACGLPSGDLGEEGNSGLKLFPVWILYWLGLRPAFLPHLETGPSLCQSKETLHSVT